MLFNPRDKNQIGPMSRSGKFLMGGSLFWLFEHRTEEDRIPKEKCDATRGADMNHGIGCTCKDTTKRSSELSCTGSIETSLT